LYNYFITSKLIFRRYLKIVKKLLKESTTIRRSLLDKGVYRKFKQLMK
jgi:hypothetical protein